MQSEMGAEANPTETTSEDKPGDEHANKACQHGCKTKRNEDQRNDVQDWTKRFPNTEQAIGRTSLRNARAMTVAEAIRRT
jgi:hypothetical protein